MSVVTIAFITTHAPSLVNFRAKLIACLQEKNVRVVAIAPSFDKTTREFLENLNIQLFVTPMSRTGMNPIVDTYNLFLLMRLLRKIKPDATFGYFIKPVIYGSIASWLAGIQKKVVMIEGLGYVFTPGIGSDSFKRRALKILVMFLYKLGMSRADNVIFLNPDDQADFIQAGLLPPSKAFLLGGIGVDLGDWVLTTPIVKPVTFLLVARLLREKGIEDFAAAARIVKNLHPHSQFILLGGLDDNPGSIKLSAVQKWMDEGVLEWYGHVPVKQWLEKTSVFVLPSYYREGVPASTQEALAMGRAVITTDVPGCRETVVNGVNGYLVPPCDPTALAAKMCFFIDQPELIVSMGLASRNLAEERFDVKKANTKLLSLLLGNEQIQTP